MTRKRTAAFAYGLLAPAFLIVVLLKAYPIYVAVDLSLRQGRTMNLSQVRNLPLGLQNYVSVLTDSATWHSLWISVIYTVASVGLAFLIGLGTALLLNQRFAGRRWLRTLVLVPWSVPGVVVVIGFVWMLDASYGVVNYLLRTLGLITTDIAWFSSPETALFAVILPTVWKGYPFFTLMLLAALQSIPGELYEAARVDGASTPALFRWITWPAVQATAALALVLNGLWVFREFDFVYATTGGGPVGATETLAIRIYQEAFSYFRLGTASALGIITLLICAVAVLGTLPIIKQRFF